MRTGDYSIFEQSLPLWNFVQSIEKTEERRYMAEKTVIWRSRKSFCTVVDDDDMLSSSPLLASLPLTTVSDFDNHFNPKIICQWVIRLSFESIQFWMCFYASKHVSRLYTLLLHLNVENDLHRLVHDLHLTKINPFLPPNLRWTSENLLWFSHLN